MPDYQSLLQVWSRLEEFKRLYNEYLRETIPAPVFRPKAGYDFEAERGELTGEQADGLRELVELYAPLKEGIGRVGRLAKSNAAWEALRQVSLTAGLLESFGLEERVRLDFSLVNSMDYYNGVIFQGFLPGLHTPVLSGGRYDNLIGKFTNETVPAVGFSIGFERVCGILLEQGYQIPGAKPKMALLYLKDADFAAVLAKAESLRADYDVTVLPQAKKLGKQFGTLEAAGFNAVAFADNEDVKLLGQKAE